MKKIFTFLFVILSFNSFSQAIFTESFNYTPDAVSGLAAQSAGVWSKVNSGDSILVAGGNLSYSGLAASVGNKITYGGTGTDYYRGFTSQTSGTVYCSFLLNVTSIGTLGTTGGYILALTDGTTTNFASTLWIRLSGTSDFNIGINPRTTTANTVWLPNTLNVNTTYLVVIALNSVSGTTNDISKIWINPVSLGGVEPTPDLTSTNTGTDLTSIQRVLLRQPGTAAEAPAVLEIDEMRVGTTWADVTPTGTISGSTLTAGTLTNFGNIRVGTNSSAQSFSISSSNLTGAPGNLTITAPVSGNFQVSADNNTWGATASIPYASATLSSTPVYVRFTPQSAGVKTENITITGGGLASPVSVSATGNGYIAQTPPSSPSVVISQIYGGGGTAGATYNADYVELHNNTSTTQDISGYKLLYGSAAGLLGSFAGNRFVFPQGTTIASGGYLLVAGAAGVGQSNLPVSNDLTFTFNLSAVNGKVVLGTSSLIDSASLASQPAGSVVDFVGYGTATEYETLPVPALDTLHAAFRNSNGCDDTNFNLNDFTILTPLPRNSNSPVAVCNAPTPVLSVSTASLNNFGSICVGSTSSTDSFTISGTNLTSANIKVGPLNGFVFSSSATGPFSDSVSISHAAGTVTNIKVYVKFAPTNAQAYSGNCSVSGAGATAVNVAVSGTGTALTEPAFNQVASVCRGTAFSLPATSNNSISGTWSPAIDTTVTTTYIFTPTAGQCADTASMTVTVNQPTVPSFTQIAAICTGGSFTLPTTSNNIITGAWTPAVNTSTTTTYTFTPTAGQCATTTTMTVAVNPPGVEPLFTQVAAICSGSSFTLPTTSTNSITGTWSPAINNTTTTTYVFTPAGGQCADTASMTVAVTPNVTPTFNQVAAICSGGTFTLPTTSTNNITGTWSPAINNTATTTYTFTPTAGQCANTTSMTVTVTPNVTPTFNQVAAICSGGSFTLPTTSTNNITGTWSPAINNTVTTTYKFTPTAGQCADTATMTVTVNPSSPTMGATNTSSLSSSGVTINGTLTQGCASITAYGVIYSTTSGFNPATTGTTVTGSNLAAGSFSVTLSGLNASTTYYYVTYATTSGGTVYGVQSTFTTSTVTVITSPIAAWNFFGLNTTTPYLATLAATTFDANLVTLNNASNITRGDSAVASAGSNSFRTTGFKNNGISILNKDYFQTTLQAASGYELSLDSIKARFAGTASYYAAPGVTSQYAYSLDGSNFTLIGSPVTSTSLSLSVDVRGVAALQNVANGTIIYIRYYASGQTATGGWGFTSSTAANNGLEYYGAINTTAPRPTFSLTPTSLNFGSVCLSAGTVSDSFRVSGVNLTSSDITVGPLNGYTFALNAGGPFTNSVTITQGGGTFNATTVYVNFTPNAIQTYNGNIPVSGAGANTVNIAVVGSGSNQLTPAFTQVAAICSGQNFTLPTTSNNGIIGSWSPAINNTITTTYTFNPSVNQCATSTTMTVVVNSSVLPTFTQVDPICTGQTFTLPTTSLNAVTGTWSPAINNTATTTYTFTPSAGQCATLNTMTVTVNSSSVAVNTDDSSDITTHTAVLHGSYSGALTNCSSIVDYGIEYSPFTGFNPGTGIKVFSSNINNASFSSNVTGLIQNTAYYYRAFVNSLGGIAYGDQKLFITAAIPTGLTIYNTPVIRGTNIHYTISGVKPGHYSVRIFNNVGQLVFQRDMVLQVNFIDDNFIIPASLPAGVYTFQVLNPQFKIQKPLMIQ